MREKCTDSEWTTLQYSPLWVFAGVAAIDGKIDEKEAAALLKELYEAGLYKSDLAREIFGSVAGNLSALHAPFRADGRNLVDGLRQVKDILAKYCTPKDANDYKQALVLLGKNIASASGGGGIFKKKSPISDKEMAALVAIMAVLDIQT